MKEEIVIAGFGGQGVLSMGKILAYAGLMDKLEVTWMPSYGPEQRGGTANVTVILSDKPISSPVLNTLYTALVLKQKSRKKFQSKVKKECTLIYDPSSIHHMLTRTDIKIVPVDAMTAAIELNNSKTYNMILLGALLKTRPVVEIDAVLRGLKKTLPERHHHLIPLNEQALRKGMEMA